jgi:hypothetical protein
MSPRSVTLAIALLAALPSAAQAGEIHREGDAIVWSAGPGEANNVTLGAAGIQLTDSGAALTAGAGCIQTGPNSATCDATDVREIVLEAGDGADRLQSAGTIAVTMIGGTGADTFVGGAEYDVVSYEFHGEPVTAAIDGTPSSGSASDGPAAARDTIGTDVETLWGSPGDDQLTGSTADNNLWGGAGADVLTGGAGLDIVDYSDRVEGVKVSLNGVPGSGSTGDGAGDTVGADVEGVFGGDGPDTLTGNTAQNLLDGAGGDDRIEARDDVSDLVLCGVGTDTAIVDALDSVENCETTQRLLPAPTGPVFVPRPSPAPPRADTLAPTAKLSAAKQAKRKTALAKGISAQVTCSETCTLAAELRVDARAAKKLKLRSRTVGKATATSAGKIVVRFSADAKKRLRNAKTVDLTLQVVATDAAGNRATVTRKVRLRR